MAAVVPSNLPIQQPPLQFNQPTSEGSVSAMGAAINYLLNILAPVGTIWSSMLDEPTFQGQITGPSPQSWVLADGRNVFGSAYATLTGNSNIPDLRGMYLRGLNNGNSAAGSRSDGNQDPSNPTLTGTYEGDQLLSHTHNTTVTGQTDPSSAFGSTINFAGNDGTPESATFTSTNPSAANGEDNRPRTMTVNHFIRIN